MKLARHNYKGTTLAMSHAKIFVTWHYVTISAAEAATHGAHNQTRLKHNQMDVNGVDRHIMIGSSSTQSSFDCDE